MKKARQPKFVTSIVSTMRDVTLQTAIGKKEVSMFSTRSDEIFPGITRITKGLLRHFYPSYDYRTDEFTVIDIHSATLLPKGERKLVGSDIKAAQYGWPLGLPLVDSLGDGLWEIRSRLPTRIARTIFFVHDGTIILLHGFIKKTRITPNNEFDLAKRRKREIQKQPSRRK